MSSSRPGTPEQENLISYVRAYDEANWAEMLRLAREHQGTMDLNPVLPFDGDNPHDIAMTLAADMISTKNEEAIATIREISQLEGFRWVTTDTMSYGTPPVDVLHAAAMYGYKDLVTACLNSLAHDPNQLREYVNQPVSMGPRLIANALMNGFIAEKFSPEICEMLLAAGGDPYVLVKSPTGSESSLFFQEGLTLEQFSFYMGVLERDPKKLTAYLNKTSKLVLPDGSVVHPNKMEEVLVLLAAVLRNKGAKTEVEVLNCSAEETQVEWEKLRMMQELHRKHCFDLEKVNSESKNNKRDFKKEYNAMLLMLDRTFNTYGKIFADLFTYGQKTKLENAEFPYLRLLNIPFSVTMDVIDVAAGVSPYFFVASRPVLNLLISTVISRPGYQASMRRQMQPYHGLAQGHTPITYAVLFMNLNFVTSCIVDSHPELNSPVVFGPLKGMTPLILAIMMQQDQIAESLMAYFFKVKKMSVAEFSDEPISGTLAGFTVKLAMEYASTELKRTYTQYKNTEFSNNLRAAREAKKQAESEAKLAAASRAAARETTNKKKSSGKRPADNEKRKNDVVVANLAPAAVSASVSLSGQVNEANNAIKIYNAFLQQMKKDAREKVETMYGVESNEKSELDKILEDLENRSDLPQVQSYDDAEKKLSACKVVSDELNKIVSKFNATYKKCERIKKQQAYHYVADDNNATTSAAAPVAVVPASQNNDDDGNDVVSASPTKVSYDLYDKNLVKLESKNEKPVKVVKQNKSTKPVKAKPAQEKMSLAELNQMFSVKAPQSNISELQKNKRAYSLMVMCRDNIASLRKSYNQYKADCAAKRMSGLSDVDSAIAVSSMQAEALAIFETLLTIQREYVVHGIYRDDYAASSWRDMSKYAYVYIFSHEANYFNALITATLDVISTAVNNRLQGKQISTIEARQRPEALVRATEAGTENADASVLQARLNNMLAIVQDLNARTAKFAKGDSATAISAHQSLVRAKLFCLALVGQIVKDMRTSDDKNLSANYSSELMSVISRHPHYQSFLSDAKTEKTPALLNHFSRVIAEHGGAKLIETLIAEMSMHDMMRLLREILNVTSHQVESEWVMLNNRHIREVADWIAMRCQVLHTPKPTAADRAKSLLARLDAWMKSSDVNLQATQHRFFISMMTVLDHIANDRIDEARQLQSVLVASVGMPNRFESFAKQYVILNDTKSLLMQVHELYTEVTTVAVSTSRLKP